MKPVIFALIPLILSMGIVPAIPSSDADSTVPSAKSNLDNAFTAATFADEYKDMQFTGKRVSVVIKVAGESENPDPAKQAKEIRYLQSYVLKFLLFSDATNVVSNQQKNEIAAQMDSAWIPVLEQRGDVVSVTLLEEQKAGTAYHDLSPRKQMAHGIALENVSCAEGLAIVLKSSDYSPACVRPSSVEKLIQRGWAMEKTSDSAIHETTLTAAEAEQIAEEAYIYGFPLVMMDTTSKILTNVPDAGIMASPINQFAHMDAFPDPDFAAVATPNADTLYSTAFLDLSDEPIVLHVPDTDGRYYLMQMMDAWTNVFDSPGKRTTGTLSGDFVITGPFWDGLIPDGTAQIKSPTNLVWIIGRTQTNGVSDYDLVHEIQKQYTLTPLSSFGKSYLPPKDLPVDSKLDMKTATVKQVAAMDASAFFNIFSLLMGDNPASSADSEALKKFEKIGLVPGKPFDTGRIDSDTLDLAVKNAQQKISDEWKTLGTASNGWQMLTGVGTYGDDYSTRAIVSWYAIGANLPEDAMYPKTSVDADGNALNGKSKYVIHFAADNVPPVNAFWSITMYNMDQFFVKNPIDRYAIGDRDNLAFNGDGSLDIYIQNEMPAESEANWLPSPQDDFTIVMRMYWPQPEILSGEWAPPAVEMSK